MAATRTSSRTACRILHPAERGRPYWRDVGTLDAFWEANLELTRLTPALNLYDQSWPIWTHQEQLPPAKFVFDLDGRRGAAVDSMVSGGCIVSGSTLRNCILFSSVRVHSYCEISEAVILPDVTIGRGAKLRRVIVDQGCRIPEGLVAGHDPAEDRKRFHVTDKGITLSPRNAGAIPITCLTRTCPRDRADEQELPFQGGHARRSSRNLGCHLKPIRGAPSPSGREREAVSGRRLERGKARQGRAQAALGPVRHLGGDVKRSRTAKAYKFAITTRTAKSRSARDPFAFCSECARDRSRA